MGQVRKINEEYFIEFYARGLLYQQKAGQDYDRAMKMLQDVEEKISAGEMGTMVRDVACDIFFEDYANAVKGVHTAKTYKRFQEVLTDFSRFLETIDIDYLSQITPAVMEKFKQALRQQKLDAAEINLKFVLIWEALEHARGQGWINDHPMLHLRWEKMDTKKYFSLEEVKNCLAPLNDQSKEAGEFMFLTGLSEDELKSLVWAQVDAQGGVLKIIEHPFENSTISRARIIPLQGRAVEILSARSLNKNLKGRIFNEDASQNLNVIPSELIRNTFIYGVLQKGVSLGKLYLMLGLEDISDVVCFSAWLPRRI